MADELDNLEAFCEVLQATQAGLEEARGEFTGHQEEQRGLVSNLRVTLKQLTEEVASIDGEADQAGPAAAKEVSELLEAARRSLEERLPALQDEVAGTAKELHEALSRRTDTLEEGCELLRDQGFAPVLAILAREQAGFEAWTPRAEAAVDGFVQALEPAAAAVDDAVSELSASAISNGRMLQAAAQRLRDHLAPIVSDNDARRAGYDGLAASMTQEAQQLLEAASALEATCLGARARLQDLASEARDAVLRMRGLEAGYLAEAADALGEGRQELERVYDATAAVLAPVADFVTTTGRIPEAERAFEQIQAVLDTLAP